MGTGGLAARSWLEDDESSRLDVWRSSRHFHLLQVLALGCFSPHHKPIGHEGALHVPGHDSPRPVSYPVGIRRTPVALWAAGCLHRDTNKKNKRPFTPPPWPHLPPVPPPAVTSCPRPLWRPQHTTAGLPRRPAARWIAVWTRISAWARVAPQGTPEATAAGRALRGGISNAHRGERHLLLLGMG